MANYDSGHRTNTYILPFAQDDLTPGLVLTKVILYSGGYDICPFNYYKWPR